MILTKSKPKTCDNCKKPTKKYKQKNCNHLFCDMKCRDEYRMRKNPIPTFACDNCGKIIRKQKTHKHIFCSLSCRDKFKIQKYSHLETTFEKNIDETSYLFGLIMGDGHFKKSGKHTTRISIAFNLNDKSGLKIASLIFKKLKIKSYAEKKTPNNCKTIGFILPDDLLSNYGLLFHGNKYDNQPMCPKNLIKNINFAIGLFNSDGCWYKSKKANTISFVNTVQSIMEDMKECLLLNNIYYRQYNRKYKNKPTWKPSTTLSIMRKESRNKILSCRYCKWKT